MKNIFLIFLIFLVMAFSLNWSSQRFIFPLALAMMGWLDRRVFRSFLRWKFLVFLVILIIGVPLFVGDQNAKLMGISYSSNLLKNSIVMGERSIVLLMGLKYVTLHISVDQMAQLISNSCLQGFRRVFSLSMQILPDIKSIANSTLQEYRLYSMRNNFLSNISRYSIKLIVRLLQYAQDCSDNQLKGEISNE